MKEASFKTGQVWNYHTRVGEEQSKIYLVRIDIGKKDELIYHLFIDGLKIKNPATTSGIQGHLPHSPVSEQTLRESVTSLITSETSPLPDISEGYAIWKNAYDNNQGGVFSIPVKNIIEYIETSINVS